MANNANSMFRNILAIVAGVIVGVVAILVVQAIGHQVYPPPANVDLKDEEAMRAFVAGLPAGALLFVIASYAVGSFAAGMVAASIGRGAGMRHALVAGAVLLLAGIMNLMAIPHPLWFSLTTLLVFIPAAWLGGKAIAGAGRAGSESDGPGE